MLLQLLGQLVVQREQPPLERAVAERDDPVRDVPEPARRRLDDAEPAVAGPRIDAEDAQLLLRAAPAQAESASIVFSSISKFA
jgi:hypothetical protein